MSDKGKNENDDSVGNGHNDGDHNDDGHSDNGKVKAKGKSDKDAEETAQVEAKSHDHEHDGNGHGDGDHNDDGHSDNGKVETKGKADKDADETAQVDAKSHDHEHDGNGHGDGDHNDDGHSDNGKGPSDGDHDDHDGVAEQAAAAKAAAEAAAQAEADAKAAADAAAAAAQAQAEADAKAAAEAAAAQAQAEADAKAAADAAAHAITLATVDVLDHTTGGTLTGKSSDDMMSGGAGDDVVRGKAGDDTLYGDGDATFTVALDIKAGLAGHTGADGLEFLISGMPKGSTLSAGQANDDGTWSLKGDEIVGLKLTAPDSGDVTLTVLAQATDGSGMKAASDLHVTLLNGNNDTLVGGSGNDKLEGGTGDDLIYGGSIPVGTTPPHVLTVLDDDLVHGGDGNDTIYGNAGDDVLHGDAGNDWISGGKNNDIVFGGDGNDVLYGNTGDDRISDGAGNDWVSGGKGDDAVVAGEGDDTYNGGSGFDTLDFSNAKGGLKIDLKAHTAEGMGSDAVIGFERVIASDFNDVLFGDSRDNVFFGGAGNDTFGWHAKSVKAGVVDAIEDFAVGDTLDLRELMAGQKGAKEVVVKDDVDGSHVYANLGGHLLEVVMLEGFHGHSTDEMLKAGMILV